MKPFPELELTETQIQGQVLDFLKAIKVRAWRNNTGKRGGVRYGLCVGSSDIIANFHGLFSAIEIKKPGEVPDADQWKFINDAISDGGIGFYACSVDEVRDRLILEVKQRGLK